jgi:PAS domain S-box-containing protein
VPVASRASFEALLAELSTSFIHLPSARVDEEIDRWLKRLMDFLGAGRCSIGEVSSDGKLVITHTFAAPGVPPAPTRLDSLTWYVERLRQGEIVVLEDLPASLPEAAAAEREFVVRQGMKAHIGIPLVVGGSFVGAAGMAWFGPAAQWPPGVVSRLRMLGEVFGNALARRRDHERLDQSEARFQTLLETAPDAMLLVAADGRIVLVNQQAERLFGYRRDELLGQPVELLVPETLREKYVEHRRRFRSDPRPRPMGGGLLLHGQHKDGSHVPVEVSLSPVETQEGFAVSALIRDITKRKRTEEALRQLSGRLITAEEEGRARLARELHDDVNQRLALLSVELERLGQKPPASAAALRKRVGELLAEMRELSSDVQRMSHRLHPSKLDHLGLVTAVKGLCQEYTERRGIRVRFQAEDVSGTLPRDVSLCLYRLAQEALTNVARHSGADEVEVRLVGSADSIRLQISDSGVGFDPASADEQRGLGLISMRERLRLVNGTMTLDSDPSHGTRIEAAIPLPAARDH